MGDGLLIGQKKSFESGQREKKKKKRVFGEKKFLTATIYIVGLQGLGWKEMETINKLIKS